jgi:hypothetical protein
MNLKVSCSLLTLILIVPLRSGATEPVAFPIFLKQGFSTVLEFESAPKRIVLGDAQSFQAERMEKSLVVRATAASATGNLFVFFDTDVPRVFVLTASDDAEPTLYRKFEEIKPPQIQVIKAKRSTERKGGRGLHIRSAKFDPKKDFLTIDISIEADGSNAIRPAWEKGRLKFKSQEIAPTKLWAERKEVQKDSRVRGRFIFAKPNLPRDFGEATLVIPLKGESKALTAELRGSL